MKLGPASACYTICVSLVLACATLPQAAGYKLAGGGSAIRSEFVPTAVASRAWDGGLGGEPSCDELRAMWRFSKRQSRAAEITNEIPTYRDPFAYNMWEPYARPRSVVGGRPRGSDRHVYGRIVYSPQRSRSRDNSPERNRAYEEVAARLVGTGQPGKSIGIPRRKVTSFRSSGGTSPHVEHIQHYSPPAASSFEQVRDLIRAERARELQQQRMAEEAAARAASFRGLTSDSYYGKITHEPPTHPGANSDALWYGEPGHFGNNMHVSQSKGSPLAFSDVLEPTVPQYEDRDIHLYKHRSYPDTIPSTMDVENGFFH
ncbi:uncharacterized protein LOC117282116 [Cryptotermes secundus]|uniref:uncharacterized protein LOC117282116 n=1 Tax=Cryptotermes secundus TaxID=105785 RepID=UPI001454DAE5|nr:uncharacterized protein LOC117282116 [Cryptotermes secundus]XP_033606380.1 uncharacterized protein LOC117282116 [Cryptotermes secundus]